DFGSHDPVSVSLVEIPEQVWRDHVEAVAHPSACLRQVHDAAADPAKRMNISKIVGTVKKVLNRPGIDNEIVLRRVLSTRVPQVTYQVGALVIRDIDRVDAGEPELREIIFRGD